ncbi:MAG TPA: carboxypeptidase-like regulatory domain-containing protein [Kofleriaceae bacterium]|nr:carboxypeptidase-like regulatory domain-containing protein [Kofleriaceae bacterium]
MTRLVASLSIAFFVAGAAGCGGDEEACDPAARSGCDDGLVCEVVMGGEPACFSPVVLRGQVFDLADGGAIEGARVVALDVNRAPQSSVAVTDVDGNYELSIPTVRDTDGNIIGTNLTLRADAAGYQTFPSGLRQAIAVATQDAADKDGKWVIESPLTKIGLIELGADAGTGIIRGNVDIPDDHNGVMVVAETSSGSGSATGFAAIADRDGDYAIFNLPDGGYTVTGYARGSVYEAVDADVTGGQETTVDLALTGDAPATLSGKVAIVNPGAGSGTSVILVVASTFDPVLKRGETPPGMRAPAPGTAPDVTGNFTIDGVPPGDYAILAAFENDFLVRDPDTCIAGTDVVFQTFASGDDLVLDESFKVTGALDVLAPGADGAEQVTGTPTFTWADDSSEDGYALTVFNSFGEIIWETTIAGTSGSDPEVVYAGPPLEAGQYYQYRVVSTKASGTEACELSQTEDLKGVFYLPAQ